MMTNPMEECPVDELIDTLTITCKLEFREGGGKRTNGWLWMVRIPEINYEGPARNLTKELAMLVASVEESNDEIMLGEPTWDKDKDKLKETALGLHDHDADQQAKLRKLKHQDKWPSVSPAETMTPRRSIT